jgi:predicted ArsR family transcriptional regulator
MDPVEKNRTSDRLLMLLKTRGGLTTKALAAALDISVPAVRQHLRALAEQVEMEERRSGVGRPAQVWRLTEAAQKRFPDTHGELTVRLIDSIETALGPGALDKVIDDRFARMLQSYRHRLDGVSSVGGKLRRLAAIRSEEGYMAEVQRHDDGWLLIENHCPICAAATRCQGFCRNELALFQSVLGDGVSVERAEYLLESADRCTYLVRTGL